MSFNHFSSASKNRHRLRMDARQKRKDAERADAVLAEAEPKGFIRTPGEFVQHESPAAGKGATK